MCHPVPRSNLAESSRRFPGRAGGEEVAAKRRVSPPQRQPLRWRRLGLHAGGSSRGHRFQDTQRAEERSARTQAPTAPWPGQLSGHRGWRRSRWLQGARSAPPPGSHPFPLARARLECGVVIVTLRSGGASQRSCSGCGSRCPRLGRAGCRPGGALTSPPCSAPVPPHPPPFTLPLSVEPTCCSRKAHARQDAQIPPCRPLLRASALPSLPPLGRVCTTAEAPAC